MVGKLAVRSRGAESATKGKRIAPLRAACLCALSASLGYLPLSTRAADPPEAPLETAPQEAPGVRVPISLLFGNTEIGQPVAVLTEDGRLLALGAEFIGMMQPILIPERVEMLKALQDADGLVPADRLAAIGIQAVYNHSNLAIRVSVPIELRTPQAISIASRQPPYGNFYVLRPATASAYVNVRAADDYRSRDGLPEDQGRRPAIVGFDAAAAALGMTLEGTVDYTEQSDDPWRRDDVRLVKDFPEARNRLTIGDLNYGTTGFQSFQQAGGVSLARNTNLQPYTVTSSTAEQSFTLDRRSQVDILINGRRVRTIDLDAGRYNLRDLPLATGTNDITLRITDEVGRVETIRFPFVFDTNLLAPGEQEFSYAVGARSVDTPRSKAYEDNDPMLSAFHAIGVTESLTLGTNLQAVERQQVVGAEARLGTLVGIFRTDLAMSHSSYEPTDVAARLQYRLTEPPEPGGLNRNLLGNFAYRGKSFLPITATEAANPTSFDAGIVYGQRLPFDITASVGTSFQFDSGGSPSGTTYDVNFGKQLADSLYLDVFGRLEKERDSEDVMSVLLTLSWIPFDSRQRVTYQRDTLDRSHRVDWSYMPTDIIGGIQADVSATSSSDTDEERVRGTVTYVDYRFEAQLRDDETYGGSSTGPRRTTGLRVGTALAFADGHLAVTRPITDSFVMIAPHKSLAGHAIEVNPTVTSQPQARADALGPGVLPNLPAYYVRRVSVDVLDPPEGYDLGDTLVNVEPYYRSGTLFVVGSGATVAAEGALVDGEGKSIPLQVGAAVPIDMPGREPRLFFTDDKGAFQIVGLAPGRYELRLDAVPDVVAVIEIPPDTTGIVDLGTLTLPTGRD